jgi:Ca2+:H+ antiporter
VERSVWLRWINLGLFLIPVVLLREKLGLEDGPLVLILAALTLVPLSSFLESAVEELEELFGQFIGGLLHTTFGNAAELAIALTLLLSVPAGDETGSQIVLSSIAGVVIRNSLLILGFATIAGAIKNGRMRFSTENASEYSSFFALAVTGLCLPTAAFFVARANDPEFDPARLVVFGQYSLSLLIGVALLLAYFAYILFAVFRLRAGENLVEAAQARREERMRRKSRAGARFAFATEGVNPFEPAPGVSALFSDERQKAEAELAAQSGRYTAPTSARDANEPRTAKARYAQAKREARKQEARARAAERGSESAEGEGEGEGFLSRHKWLRIVLALVILGAAATGVVFMSEAFAGSVEHIGKQFEGYVNPFFLGLIVIPVVGGAVELFGATGMARRNLIDITMGVTAGASIQMVTVVVPVLVIVGYLTNHPLLLHFNPLDVIIFVAASFLFMLLSRDGEATVLEGVQLCSLWALLAATAYFLPPPFVG